MEVTTPAGMATDTRTREHSSISNQYFLRYNNGRRLIDPTVEHNQYARSDQEAQARHRDQNLRAVEFVEAGHAAYS